MIKLLFAIGKTTKAVVKTTANVTTLGGLSRLANKQKAYKNLYEVYQKDRTSLDNQVTKIQQTIEKLGTETLEAIYTIKKVEIFLNKVLEVNKNIDNNKVKATPYTPKSIFKIQTVNSSLSTTMALGKGSAASAAFTMGSWTLVSMLGSASTGTAIGTLSGVAATNAGLAWFGGGSLAAGGTGMVGGAATLSLIAIVPLIAFSSWKTHKSANELNTEIEKIKRESIKIETSLEDIKNDLYIASSNLTKFTDNHSELKRSYEQIRLKLYPWGWLSKLKRSIESLLGSDYYAESDLKLITLLDNKALAFTELFNTSEKLS